MKKPDLEQESVLEDNGSSNHDLSRRRFLHSAAVAGVAAVTLPMAGAAKSGRQAGRKNQPERHMEKVLSGYGSEFGDLRGIR
jgi:hypothetical protein